MKLDRRTLLRAIPVVATLPRTIYAHAATKKSHLIIGTGTGAQSKSKGLYVTPWNAATGEMGEITLAATLSSPTFFAIDKTQRYLYAINEGRGGGITSFRIAEGANGPTLTLLNKQPTPGGGATHISVSHNGKCVFIANYGGGSCTSYAVNADGSLTAPVSHYQTHPVDSDPIHARPHIHECTPSPDDKWLLVNDLGSDRIWVYSLDAETAKITPAPTPFWQGRYHSGPRHLRFHPNRKWVYSVNELDSTVDHLLWDTTAGTLTTINYVSTLPADYPKNKSFASDVVISSDGKFAYVGNRGIVPEVVTVFSIDKKSGALGNIQMPPDGVVWARDLTLDPSERYLLVAGQRSGTVSVLSRNKKTGMLSAAPLHTYNVDSAQCLVFTI